MPDLRQPAPSSHPDYAGLGGTLALPTLTLGAFQLRSCHRYALHPVEAAFPYHRASTEGSGAPGDATDGFEQAEGIYRAGAQGLRLSEIPQLPQQLTNIVLLDKVQKEERISKEDAARLRKFHLVEGRYPNLFFSANVAAITGGQPHQTAETTASQLSTVSRPRDSSGVVVLSQTSCGPITVTVCRNWYAGGSSTASTSEGSYSNTATVNPDGSVDWSGG